MLQLKDDIKCFIASSPVDMRKSINGLSVLVVELLEQNPQCGHVFVFYNRQRNKVKLIYWNKNGFLLLYKQLEKGRFKLPRQENIIQYEIDQDQLRWLLAGFDFINLKQYPELNATYFA